VCAFFAALVPIIGIALFGTYIIGVEYSRYSGMGKLQNLTEIALQISAVMHELQSERGISSAYITNGGRAPWNSRLNEQIAATDAVIARVAPALRVFQASGHSSDVEEQTVAQQAGTSAEQVLSSAEELSQTAENLRSQVSTFVQNIRVA